jgi:hypothetical protein
MQGYSEQNRSSYTYQGFSDPGFQQQEPQQHTQYTPVRFGCDAGSGALQLTLAWQAQTQPNIANTSGSLMSGQRGSYQANVF